VILITCLVSGSISIYESKKNKAKLLFFTGICFIFGGLLWLGIVVDFFTVILTGANLDNSYGLQGILGYLWLPILMFSLMNIAGDLLVPKKKWYLISIYTILGIIYDVFFILDPIGSLDFKYPSNPGENLIGDPLAIGTPVFILLMFCLISTLLFLGLGSLIKGVQSKGIIRRKFLLFSLGVCMFVIFIGFDQTDTEGIIQIFIRVLILAGFLLVFVSIREAPVEHKERPPKKEVLVEEGLFRLIKRPAQVTEEEVSISREKKICLVCKGKLEKFNIYICSQCDTFYCEKCALSLSDLENMCWVCEEPFDDSKPVNPLKREEETLRIEISGDHDKRKN
ncbi:hypothetical protein LCGC14_2389610, partial [marine sediment metagenome]